MGVKVGLGLAGCAGPALRTISFPAVKPGQLFTVLGGYVDTHAPSSEGWELIQLSPTGLAFAKGDRVAGESFVAQVAVFNLAPTRTPEELEQLIRSSVERENTDPTRFDVQQESFRYSTERSYPCIRYEAAGKDKAPQGPQGPLVLECGGIYCRHPVRQDTGFAAIYSHRGKNPYPNLRIDVEAFIQGVQVPGK